MLVNRSVLTSIYSNRQNQTNITVFQKFEITQKTEIARERSTIGRRVLTRGACVDSNVSCADPWITSFCHAPTCGRLKGFMRRPVSYALTLCVDACSFALTPSSLGRAFASTRELWADPYGRLKAFKSAKRLWLVIFMYLVMITLCLYVFNDCSSFRITWKRIWWVMCCICS